MADWLYRFTAKPNSVRALRTEWCLAVWSAFGHSVATDGRVLIALRDGGVSEGLGCDDATRPAVEKALAPFLGPAARRRRRAVLHTTLGELWSFLGQIDVKPCASCDSDTRVYCDDCDGTRLDIAPDVRPVNIGGHALDANLLARALAPELAGDDGLDTAVRVGFLTIKADIGKGVVAVFDATDSTWRVVTMTLYADGAAVREAGGLDALPRFYPGPVFQGLWVERHMADAAMVMADWIEEHHHTHYISTT